MIDPSELIDLLETEAAVVLIDAVLGTPAGAVVELDATSLASEASPTSTHGVSVAQALGLRRAFGGGPPAPPRIVAITISPPRQFHEGLSPEVAAAVPAAAQQVVRGVGEV